MIRWGSGGNGEEKINIYTLLYIKYAINKDLLHCTGSSTRYSVITYVGKRI